MAILASFQNHEVELTDIYESGGITLASARATAGKPFVGGDRWPVYTEYTTVKVHELQNIRQAPENATLLSIALAFASKKQWANGEAVTLTRSKDGKVQSFLKCGDGLVRLHIVGYTPSLVMFNLTEQGWRVVRNVETSYRIWANKAKASLKK